METEIFKNHLGLTKVILTLFQNGADLMHLRFRQTLVCICFEQVCRHFQQLRTSISESVSALGYRRITIESMLQYWCPITGI